MFGVIEQAPVTDRGEDTLSQRHADLGHALDLLLRPSTVGDESRDRDEPDRVSGTEAGQFGQPGECPVGVHDLANGPSGPQAGQAGQVYGGLGVPGPPQYATGTSAQREDMSRPDDVLRRDRRVG